MDQDTVQNFPVDWEDDNYVTRREFMKFGTLASGAFAAGSLGLAAWSKVKKDGPEFEPQQVALVQDIQPGAALPFNFPRPKDLCLLIQKPDGEYVAYGRRCTHLSCPVVYEAKEHPTFLSMSQRSFFRRGRQCYSGPPPHAIPQITLEIRGDEIWATGVRKHGDESHEA
ncbi:MAG: Rieske 2Fe-2S domain-containing protein [Fimbriimonadaceae bacterium]